MKFEEAIKLVKEGAVVQRNIKPITGHMTKDQPSFKLENLMNYVFTTDDILAEDWELKPIEQFSRDQVIHLLALYIEDGWETALTGATCRNICFKEAEKYLKNKEHSL